MLRAETHLAASEVGPTEETLKFERRKTLAPVVESKTKGKYSKKGFSFENWFHGGQKKTDGRFPRARGIRHNWRGED